MSSEDVLENSEKEHGKHEQSVESENEVFLDDFEELNANSASFSNVTTEVIFYLMIFMLLIAIPYPCYEICQ